MRCHLIIGAALACLAACGPQVSDEVATRVEIVAAPSAGELTLPNALTSVKFAVIGDSGRGSPEQHQVAAQMARSRERFDFDFVLMVGDNIYEGPASPEDYRLKFEEPYKDLLEDGVKFFAVLGNHDDPRQVEYAPFNMGGQRYYSFAPPADPLTRLTTRVEFFALDSTTLDRPQVAWLDERLGASRAEWKVVFLHHPLYTSGRYRNHSLAHRWALEPVLTRHDVSMVFSGHEHIYQRTELQQGILYFVTGAAGSLRHGDGVAAPFIARTFADDYHFMLVEIDDGAIHFQAISRSGHTIDAGTLHREAEPAPGRQPTEATTPGTELRR
jgi:hypothetical protein